MKASSENKNVSCCLHRKHCVNSGMRHRSDCRGRTIQVTVTPLTEKTFDNVKTLGYHVFKAA